MTAESEVGAVMFKSDCVLAFVGLPGGRSAGLAAKTES
jgi:hypothetical protein